MIINFECWIAEEWRVASICFVMVVKCLIAVSFAIIYNYTSELFPTVIRSTASGLGSMSARISGILIPWVLLTVSNLHCL